MRNLQFIIDLLRKFGNEYEQEILDLKALSPSMNDNIFRVVNAGQMNSGKSSLFNAITHKQELFKTGDSRTTSKNQEEKWLNDLHLVDTPGCNSTTGRDAEIAEEAFRKGDLVLYVHNLSTGGLQQADINILKKIKVIFGKADFQSRVMMVYCRTDLVGVGDDDECKKHAITTNLTECFNLIRTELHAELRYAPVSSKMYFDGTKRLAENRGKAAEMLFKESGIIALREFIQTQKTKLGKRGFARIPEIIRNVIARLEKSRVNSESERHRSQTALDKKKLDALATWAKALEKIRPAWDYYKSLH